MALLLVLRAVFLHEDDDPARHMGDADRRFGLVDVLAAGALRAHGIDAEIRLVDGDVDVLGFRQHRNRRRRGVNAAGGLGVGHALYAMHAGFEFELGEDAAAARSPR